MILTRELHLRLGYPIGKVMLEGIMTPLYKCKVMSMGLSQSSTWSCSTETSLSILTKNLLNCNTYQFGNGKDLCFTVFCL